MLGFILADGDINSRCGFISALEYRYKLIIIDRWHARTQTVLKGAFLGRITQPSEPRAAEPFLTTWSLRDHLEHQSVFVYDRNLSSVIINLLCQRFEVRDAGIMETCVCRPPQSAIVLFVSESASNA